LLNVAFWVVSRVASLLYARNAIAIFTNVSAEDAKARPAWRWHQRWLNFAGSMFGWASLWLLVRRLCRFAGFCSAEPASLDLSLGVLAFVAFIGITGYLPFAAVGLISGTSALSSKAGDLIKGLFPKPPEHK
jgi:hypothetical protein